MASIETVEMVTPEGETRHVNHFDVARFEEEHGWKRADAGEAPAPVEVSEAETAEFGEDRED